MSAFRWGTLRARRVPSREPLKVEVSRELEPGGEGVGGGGWGLKILVVLPQLRPWGVGEGKGDFCGVKPVEGVPLTWLPVWRSRQCSPLGFSVLPSGEGSAALA